MSQPQLKTVSSRSNERQMLAAAIEHHREVAQTVAAIRAAKQTASDRLYGTGSARAKVDDATAAVEKAKAAATQFLVDQAIGNAGAAPLSVKDAKRTLADAEDELDVAKSTEIALGQRLRESEQELAQAKRDIDEAVRRVIKCSPETASIFAEYEAVTRKCSALLAMRAFIAEKLHAEPDDLEDGTDDEPADVAARIASWEEAIASLRIDADASLPET